jgi:hypothetical protein
MTLPNFLIIGAAKSGTSALYTYVKQHPEIFMSTPKELRYFSYTGPHSPDIDRSYLHEGVTILNEYESYFNGVVDERIIGEASPMYLYIDGTAERIKEIIPNVKMLAIIRNPVDRAFSAYTHALRDWKEQASSFQEALELEQERIDAGWGMLWHYTKAGFYHEQLNRYFRVFDSRQMKVVLYDDLISNVSALLKEIFLFLGVDPKFVADTSSRPNVSGFPINQKYHKFLHQLFMENNPIRGISRVVVPKSVRQKAMIRLRSLNLEKRVMPEDIRKDLVKLFYNDIKKLEGLIHRDLSLWVE